MNTFKFFGAFASILLLSLPLAAEVSIGETAPGFSLQTPSGETVSLADFRGKHVVLEWVNPGCPFVKKFYDSGAMQRFQREAQGMDVVWLSINSTNPNHGDYLDPEASMNYYTSKDVSSTWLMDPTGQVGRLYGASRTPHCFIIDPAGKVVYQGAIDDNRSANPKDIAGATNYVMTSLQALAAGGSVKDVETRPYGCTIKY